jgi:hypothetical protein
MELNIHDDENSYNNDENIYNNDTVGDESFNNLDYQQYYNEEPPVPQFYWNQNQDIEVKPIKKKVTFGYTDILSNMNLVVNSSGILQKMTPLPQTDLYNQYNNNECNVNQVNPTLNANNNSYIYNKYFKDYNESNVNNQPVIRVPKTREEYIEMLIEDRAKRVQEKKRISQIKSTKLFFTAPTMDNYVIRPKIAPTIRSVNLRKMSFG